MTQEQIDRARYERLRATQPYVPMNVFNVGGWELVIALSVVGGIIGAMMYFVQPSTSTDYFRAARDSWLTECQIKGRSLEECASAWDDGITLRQVYYERVRNGAN